MFKQQRADTKVAFKNRIHLLYKTVLLCAFLFLEAAPLSSQIGYGFRAGLSYSRLDGDLESGPGVVEDYRFASGFHIGFAFNYAVTDLFGFRGELLFTQRGTEYTYKGPSWYFLGRYTEDEQLILGTRDQDLNISTANLAIPLITYFKVGSFEFSGGLNVGILLSATGGGDLNFSGTGPSGNPIEPDPFRVRLLYNYIKDNARGADPATVPVNVDGTRIFNTGTAGAYHDFSQKDGNTYKVLDLGLQGGLAFYLNKGLFLSIRGILGLTDRDDDQYDISLSQINPDGSYIFRQDKNRNITIEASIGFLF